VRRHEEVAFIKFIKGTYRCEPMAALRPGFLALDSPR
jgi:hypothetical protein